MIFNHSKVLKSCSLSTQSLASCVNYFVWNCLPCFSNTKIGSVTSFSILFNFQGPVAPQPCGWRPAYCTTEVVFCQALFFRSFWTFWTWTLKKFLRTNRELVGVSPLHLAFARPLCLLERPTGAIHCFRNRKTFQRLLVLFKGFLLWLRKSFFCLSAWRSSIIPHAGPFGNPFLQVFLTFFFFGPFAQFFVSNSTGVWHLPARVSPASRRTPFSPIIR